MVIAPCLSSISKTCRLWTTSSFSHSRPLMSSAPDSFQAEDLVKDAIGNLRHARRNTLIHTVVDGLQVGP